MTTIIKEIFEDLKKKSLGKYYRGVDFIEGLGRYFLISLFLFLFAFGWSAIKYELVTEVFELFCIMSLLLILFYFTSKIRLSNGFLGWANMWYFILGIMGVIAEEPSLLDAGQKIFLVFAVLNVIFAFLAKRDKAKLRKNRQKVIENKIAEIMIPLHKKALKKKYITWGDFMRAGIKSFNLERGEYD